MASTNQTRTANTKVGTIIHQCVAALAPTADKYRVRIYTDKRKNGMRRTKLQAHLPNNDQTVAEVGTMLEQLRGRIMAALSLRATVTECEVFAVQWQRNYFLFDVRVRYSAF